MKSLGSHLIVELYGCDSKIINDQKKIEKILLGAVKCSGAQIIQPFFHQYNPCGVSGVVIIAESHFTIHTWPEKKYCALDIFTCGKSLDNEKALSYLKKNLDVKHISIVEMKRGIGLIHEA
ncbi:S-adenosylmethionine decarboxylase proenzyme [Candidatus Magnetomorum sp. HK-1]|nr:S-adenosylmethionine decarboxylase proenzyme [Candidatus Magnetomorum sp. HK-1]